MKRRLIADKIMITGIILLLLFTIAITVVSIAESRQVNDTAKLVSHTHEVIIQSEKCLSLIADNETGSHGYLLTGEKVFLEPLIKSQNKIYFQLDQLKLLTTNNPIQQARIDSLYFYTDKRIAFSNQTISVRDLNGAEAAKAIVKTGKGKLYTDRIRRIIDAMLSTENILLVQRKDANEKEISSLNRILISVIVSILIVLGFLIQKIHTDLGTKNKAIALAKLNNELEQQVLKRTEELVKSKNILSETFERITDGFVALDRNWRYTYINKKAEEFFKHNPEEMIGTEIWSEFPEIVNNPFYKACQQSMRTQQYVYLEEYYTPFGKWFENHIYPSTDGISIFFRDITEKKKTELNIKKANERFEMIARATNDAVFELDLISGESWHNEAFLRLFNSDMTMGNIKPDISLWKSKLHPNDQERVIKKLRAKIAGSSSIWADEFRFQSADNIYYTFYDRAFISRDESGKAVRMIGSMTDITELKKIEEQLRKSELQYRSLIEQATDAIYIADTSMKYIDINPSGCRMFGYSKEEFLKLDPADLVFEEDYSLNISIINEIKSGETIRYERILKKKDGTAIEVEATGKMLEDGRFVMFARDISERKKIEKEIKRSNSQLTLSQQIAHVGYWEIDLINQSHYWSDELYHLFDLENDGKVMDLETFMNNVHPDDRQPLLKNHHNTIENNQQLNAEFRFIKKNGNIRNFHTTGSVRSDKNGTRIRIEGTTQDITERKKIENEILKEKQLSDSIINSLPGVFYLYTKDGKFLRGNKNFETITKYSADEIRKMHPLDFIDEEEKEFVSQMITNVFVLGEENVQANFLLKTKDKIPYYFTGIAIEYEGSTCLMGVGIDISERVNAQEKIKQTSEQLRQLAGHLQTIREEERKRIGREIHDELGQQLTAIKMDVAWVDKKTSEENPLLKNKLKNVINLLDESNQSIRRILSELRPVIFDDSGLLEAIEWLNRQFTLNTGIPVKFITDETEIISSEPVTTCIFRAYQEAFTNITRHAQSTQVFTSVNIIDETIVVIIEDDGKGFTAESIQNKKSFGILGMKERVILLGGRFELISSPGKGTKIIIGLPHNTSLDL